MIKRKIRKAFTLVELLVIISVLTIASTVAIIGYVSFNKKAYISNDTAVVNQVNRYLDAYTSDGKTINTVEEARDILVKEGVDFHTLKAQSKDFRFAYDLKANELVLLTKEWKPFGGSFSLNTKKEDVFAFVTTAEDLRVSQNTYGFSTYLQDSTEFEGQIYTVNKGLDVGSNTVAGLRYVNDESEQFVTIRTNSFNTPIEITGPNDTVKHFGEGKYLYIHSIAMNSFHEFGSYMNSVLVETGNYVCEQGSNVNTVVVLGNDVKVDCGNNDNVLVVVDSKVTLNNENFSNCKPSQIVQVSDPIGEKAVELFKNYQGAGLAENPFIIEDGDDFGEFIKKIDEAIENQEFPGVGGVVNVDIRDDVEINESDLPEAKLDITTNGHKVIINADKYKEDAEEETKDKVVLDDESKKRS